MLLINLFFRYRIWN